MQTNPAPQGNDLSDKDIQTMLSALNKGASIADIANMQPEVLEGMYTLGYNLYVAGTFTDAETMFRALCIYKHNESRFWMGLAGSLQGQERYAEAIDAYAVAGMCSSLHDPQPFLYAANCYIKLGDRENAINAIEGLLTLGSETDPAHIACKANARELLQLLKQAK